MNQDVIQVWPMMIANLGIDKLSIATPLVHMLIGIAFTPMTFDVVAARRWGGKSAVWSMHATLSP